MKLPSKYIALLVILSLTGIFAYQAYWLVNLYHTQRQEVEHNITEALRISDYNEMMLRLQRMQEDSVEHGSILVSAGLEDKQTYAQSRTITTIERGDSTTILYQHEKMEDSDSSTLTYQPRIMSPADSAAQPVNRKEASLQMNDVSFLLGRSNAMKELANNFQRGLHAGMDVMCDPDFPTYDRLLAELPLQLACHDSASVYQNFRAVYGGEVLYELFKQHRVFHNAASCLYHFYIIHFQYHMRSIEKEAFL